MNYQIVVGKKRFDVNVVEVGSGAARVVVNGEPYDVTIENYAEVTGSSLPSQPASAPAATAAPTPAPASPSPVKAPPAARAPAAGGTRVLAPMPGVIMSVKVRVGDRVEVNQPVVTMDAMKMENNIAATASGEVTELLVAPGDQLNTGDVILIIG